MLKFSITICTFFIITLSAAFASDDGFKLWLEQYRLNVTDKISKDTLDSILNNLEISQKALSLSKKQPEQHQSFWNYIERMINDARIRKALTFKEKHKLLLKKIENKYNIDTDYLIALHAIETDFGQNTGSFNPAQVLASLAYDGCKKRREFFKAQLTALLKNFETKKIPINTKSSWAGAFGFFQFMPATFVMHGTDFDNDKKIDLFSYADAFASAANYLNRIGLKKDEPCMIEVSIPNNFKWANLREQEIHSFSNWINMGVFPVNPEENAKSTSKAELLIPEGYLGPTFLIFNNFNVLKKWNNSNYYVTAACELVRQIKGSPKLDKSRFSNRIMSKDKIMKIQKKLADMDLYSEEIDGIIGNKTRKAIRKIQYEIGLPADGYPTDELFEIWNLENEGNN